MDFSKFEIGLYDVFAIVLPGFLCACDAWILLRGWHAFVVSLLSLTAVGLTALLLASFVLGHIISEASFQLLTLLLGKEYFKKYRYEFWQTKDGENIQSLLKHDLGYVPSVDTAFDFCLKRIISGFSKRESFVATSDLCRSLVTVGVLTAVPLARVVRDTHISVYWSVLGFAGLLTFVFLSFKRMMRFNRFSEVPVFTNYLSHATMNPTEPPAEAGNANHSHVTAKKG